MRNYLCAHVYIHSSCLKCACVYFLGSVLYVCECMYVNVFVYVSVCVCVCVCVCMLMCKFVSDACACVTLRKLHNSKSCLLLHMYCTCIHVQWTVFEQFTVFVLEHNNCIKQCVVHYLNMSLGEAY